VQEIHLVDLSHGPGPQAWKEGVIIFVIVLAMHVPLLFSAVASL